jgi:V/A-type H+-transporting ATPase subunit E
MNGIDKITSHITAEAVAEAASILAEANAQCANIRSDFARSADEAYAKIISAGETEAALLLARLDSAAQLEVKKGTLAAKQALVSRAFEMSAGFLSSLPQERYVALLVSLAVEASRTGSEELVFSASDRSKIGATVCTDANNALKQSGRPSGLTLSDRTTNISGGFILSGGDIEVNCSVSALISQRVDELTPDVAGILFN